MATACLWSLEGRSPQGCEHEARDMGEVSLVRALQGKRESERRRQVTGVIAGPWVPGTGPLERPWALLTSELVMRGQEVPSLSQEASALGVCVWGVGAVAGDQSGPQGPLCPAQSMAMWHRLGEAAGALTPGAGAFPPDSGSRGPFKQAAAHEPCGSHLGLQFPRQAMASWVAPPVLPRAGPSDVCPPGPHHQRSQDLPDSTQSVPPGDRARALPCPVPEPPSVQPALPLPAA